MSNRGGGMQHPNDSAADILYLVDQLEELVGVGKRVPLSNRVMVEEGDFLSLVDQLRVALPIEIKQAQRVIKDRERIIGEAQDEAARIVQDARAHAEKMVSQNVILKEARQRGEEILIQAEEQAQRTRGEMDVFVLEQIQLVVDAVRRGMAVMEDSVERTLETMEDAREAVQGPSRP
jgi:vacuolar-type H+-ATPase subunit H